MKTFAHYKSNKFIRVIITDLQENHCLCESNQTGLRPVRIEVTADSLVIFNTGNPEETESLFASLSSALRKAR